jgi:chromosome segregation ATPase
MAPRTVEARKASVQKKIEAVKNKIAKCESHIAKHLDKTASERAQMDSMKAKLANVMQRVKALRKKHAEHLKVLDHLRAHLSAVGTEAEAKFVKKRKATKKAPKKATAKKQNCKCADLAKEPLAEKGMELVRHLMGNAILGNFRLSPPTIAVTKVDGWKGKIPTLYCTYCPFCGKKIL